MLLSLKLPYTIQYLVALSQTDLFHNHIKGNSKPAAMALDMVSRTALTLHLLVEIPASIKFFLSPSATLEDTQPLAHGLIKQYAILLMATNLIVVSALLDSEGHPPKILLSALALYHLGPLARAMARIRRGHVGGPLGGPFLHAYVHAVCEIALCLSVVVMI